MKKGLFLLLPILTLGLCLAGCKGNKVEPTPEPEIVNVESVSSEQESFAILVGETHELNYSIAPENASNKNVTVTSESEAITIEGTTITAVAAGEAVATLTTEDGGFTVEYAISVVEATPAAVLWSVAKAAWGDEAEASDVEGPDEEGFYNLAYVITYGSNLTQEDATEENLNEVLSVNAASLLPIGLSLLQGPTFTEGGLSGYNMSQAF